MCLTLQTPSERLGCFVVHNLSTHGTGPRVREWIPVGMRDLEVVRHGSHSSMYVTMRLHDRFQPITVEMQKGRGRAAAWHQHLQQGFHAHHPRLVRKRTSTSRGLDLLWNAHARARRISFECQVSPQRTQKGRRFRKPCGLSPGWPIIGLWIPVSRVTVTVTAWSAIGFEQRTGQAFYGQPTIPRTYLVRSVLLCS